MSWLDRQSFLGANSEQRLAEMTAGLVGLGGGNSHVAQQLAHAGVGHFALADADHISLTNLNRLIGAPGGTC
jgi:tRNA A37 threonylcarbamoyladenosine dehydratase